MGDVLHPEVFCTEQASPWIPFFDMHITLQERCTPSEASDLHTIRQQLQITNGTFCEFCSSELSDDVMLQCVVVQSQKVAEAVVEEHGYGDRLMMRIKKPTVQQPR